MKRDNRLCWLMASAATARRPPIIRTCIDHSATLLLQLAPVAHHQRAGPRATRPRLGGAQGPDCSGFALAQLQALDFSRMDLTEFYAEIAPTLPNLGDLQQRAQQKVNSYFGP